MKLEGAVRGEGDAAGHGPLRVAEWGRAVCDSGHIATGSACGPGPPRLPAGGARALPVPQPRRGGRDGRPGAPRPGAARAAKPGQLVDPEVEVGVDAPPPYVSRGGVKLRNALDALGVEVAGRQCLDVGASTGGFTDCLLQAGAEHVIALDVAYGELDWSLREDERVTVMERVNARALDCSRCPTGPT